MRVVFDKWHETIETATHGIISELLGSCLNSTTEYSSRPWIRIRASEISWLERRSKRMLFSEWRTFLSYLDCASRTFKVDAVALTCYTVARVTVNCKGNLIVRFFVELKQRSFIVWNYQMFFQVYRRLNFLLKLASSPLSVVWQLINCGFYH